jgi:hypothetical protein
MMIVGSTLLGLSIVFAIITIVIFKRLRRRNNLEGNFRPIPVNYALPVPGYVQMFNVPLNTFGPHHAPVLQQARIPQPNSQPVQLGMKPELRDDLEVGLNPTLVETEERMAREFENKVDK